MVLPLEKNIEVVVCKDGTRRFWENVITNETYPQHGQQPRVASMLNYMTEK